ncbi:hypothetical protein K7X08_022588 [Anisodus acutangulus]|uniref:Uncharacterized protein n=1 Tax=Anisodus acutangulus TaxID=402998 RepID=A0A9Q1RHS1_9SOLA|nr:hypothetical protein K7X08_022588 [Anisodus acutangulus]
MADYDGMGGCVGGVDDVVAGGCVGGVDDVVVGGDGDRDDDDYDFHDGFGGGVGGYTQLSSRFSSIGDGTSKVPSYVCQCQTFKNRMNDLIKKVEELTNTQTDNNSLM